MAQRSANYPPVWDSQGESTNPTAGTVKADTGALDKTKGGGGIYEIMITASQTALAEYSLQRRNAANGANVGDELIFYGPANNTVPLVFRMDCLQDERFRVVMNANLTGDSVVTITVQKVA